MKKRKWYSISKTLIIALIAVVILYALIPAGYIWLEWHRGKILSFFIHPSAPHSTAYLDSDFVTVMEPKGDFPSGQAIFYRINTDGKAERVYVIKHYSSDVILPSKIGKKFCFPDGANGEVTVLENGKLKRYKIGEGFVRENIVSVNGKIFVLSGLRSEITVCDENMHILKTAFLHDILPEGFVGLYMYKYKGELWIMGSDDNFGRTNFDRIFAEIDPDTLKVIKTVKFPYVLNLLGDLRKIVSFRGTVYELGEDFTLKPGGDGEGHDVIYAFSPVPKPVYVSPVPSALTSKPLPKTEFYHPSEKYPFGIEKFIPIQPDKKEFALICVSRFLLTQSGKIKSALPGMKKKYYLYITSEKKFYEVPEKIYDGDVFDRNPGVFCKGHIYIATSKYLLEFKNGKFEIVDRYKGDFVEPFISRTKDLEN